jgi:hypothetical protein
MSLLKHFWIFVITPAIPHSAFKMKVTFCVTAVFTPMLTKHRIPNRCHWPFGNSESDTTLSCLPTFPTLSSKNLTQREIDWTVGILSTRDLIDYKNVLLYLIRQRDTQSCVLIRSDGISTVLSTELRWAGEAAGGVVQ